MAAAMAKPRINARSIPWLMELWERLDDFYWCSDDALRQAPSDVFDGWCVPSDLADLVRRRILTVIPVAKADQTSVSPVTWYFTDRGVKIMRAWKERARAAAMEPPTYPANCCPNCGANLEAADAAH